ncbi:MAG: polyphosphate polymerase domain-containing protein [Oscillospiraceae bacterium]
MGKVNVTAGAVFERHEGKYLLTGNQYKVLFERLQEYMLPDEYGLHTISSVYYDTDEFDIIRHSLEKPSYKEKLRLRSYGTPGEADTVFLELKKKCGGITYKRRVPLPLREAERYMQLGEFPHETGQIFYEINWMVNRYNPAAKVVLSYDRLALYGREDSELRITFDANIRWRNDNLSLSEGSYGRLLIGEGERLMEIKTLKTLPYWLSALLSELKIYPVSFSKYGRVYQTHLAMAAAQSGPESVLVFPPAKAGRAGGLFAAMPKPKHAVQR